MGARKISTRTMIAICNYWMAQPVDSLFDKYALLTSFKAVVSQVQQDLVGSLVLSENQRLEQLRSILNLLDDRHDGDNRALFYLLTALEEKATSPEIKAAFASLRDEIFPIGLRVNNLSWTEESASCQRLQKLIQTKPTVRDGLFAISITDGTTSNRTGLEWADDLIKIGQQMETALQEYATLVAKEKLSTSNNPNAISIKESQARNKFLHLVRMIRENASFSMENNPDDSILLWAKFDEEYQKANASSAKPSSESKNKTENGTENKTENGAESKAENGAEDKVESSTGPDAATPASASTPGTEATTSTTPGS